MLVAMRSHLLPSTGAAHSTYGTGDIGLQLGITEPIPPASNLFSTEWEQWGEESQIELCVFSIRFNGLVSGTSCLLQVTWTSVDMFDS